METLQKVMEHSTKEHVRGRTCNDYNLNSWSIDYIRLYSFINKGVQL